MSTDFSSIAVTNDVRLVKAPRWPAHAAAACGLLAVATILPGIGRLSLAAAGYLAGALLVPALTVVYRFGRRSAAKSPFFVPDRSIERLLLTALSVGILAGLAHAWFVATELAKQ